MKHYAMLFVFALQLGLAVGATCTSEALVTGVSYFSIGFAVCYILGDLIAARKHDTQSDGTGSDGS
jgi:hypothetical protein